MKNLFGIEMKFWYVVFASIGVATTLIVLNLFFLKLSGLFAQLIYIVAIFIAAFPGIFIKYTEYSKKKELEEIFPVFLRDFVETIRSGMSVPQAMKTVSDNDYKDLTPYI